VYGNSSARCSQSGKSSTGSDWCLIPNRTTCGKAPIFRSRRVSRPAETLASFRPPYEISYGLVKPCPPPERPAKEGQAPLGTPPGLPPDEKARLPPDGGPPAHAQWEEIDLGDVAPVIDLTSELITAHLDTGRQRLGSKASATTRRTIWARCERYIGSPRAAPAALSGPLGVLTMATQTASDDGHGVSLFGRGCWCWPSEERRRDDVWSRNRRATRRTGAFHTPPPILRSVDGAVV